MSLVQTALHLMTQYGYLGLFVFMFLETSMVFPLLPSEVVVPFAAGLLVTNPFSIVIFGLVAAAGATVGSLFAYYVFGTTGEKIAERYGTYVRVSQSEIDRSQRWFNRWGETAVLWGRLLPILRSIISIPAGFAEMNVIRFALYSGVGAFLFNAAIGGLIYIGEQRSLYTVVLNYTTNAVRHGVTYVSTHRLIAFLGVLVLGMLFVAGWWIVHQYRGRIQEME